ncbi:hypothetical protein [Bacillus litorisediminis]|uniref:hypothetical protein n=1 Tax=Bacillus litorisediminis TaxID=2922713 RepID=UPI001FAB95A4|nr:hypothetical protein [Bacillus litorisediminis]
MYSDRFTLFKASRVRIKHVFGQVYSFQSQSCPNQAYIRTGLLFSKPAVSESSIYSDRFTHFNASCVRIKHVFGQVYSFQSQPCPNQAYIRTGLLISMPAVSESSMYSDRFTLFKASRVRIKHVFGQVYSFQSQPCPNQACIRTGLLISKPVMSESSAYSDRFTDFKASRVRIKHVFGQVYSFQCQSCPNQARIRTGLLISKLVVSESSMYSDRFTHFQNQPCPNQARIRTGLLISKPVVSESSMYSDRFTEFKVRRI